MPASAVIRRIFRQLITLLAVALVPAIVSGVWQLRWGNGDAKDDPREVIRAEVEQWHEPVLWVDARSREQFDRGHAAGAVLLNEAEWNACVPAFLNAWRPEMRIVVYCDAKGGESGRDIARRLRDEFDLNAVWVLRGN